MSRTVKQPRWGAYHWPDGTVTITKVEGDHFYGLFDVAVDGKVIGRIERGENSHAIKIKGSRLSRGRTKPRVEWRPEGGPAGLWWDTAGEAISRLIEKNRRAAE